MTDQTWAVIIGGVVVVALKVTEKILNWYFPDNYISIWAKEHGAKIEDKGDENEGTEN